MSAAAVQAVQHVAGMEVKVDGTTLDPKLRDVMTLVRVRSTVALPDAATVKFSDPTGELMDDLVQKFSIGADVEVKASAIGDRATTQIFKGQVVSYEPIFGAKGAEFQVRALDKGHKLQRVRKVRTFQQVSASNMVSKIAQEAGLAANVTSTDVVFEFFQQSAETDWDFIARLARAHAYRFGVEDSKLVFEPASKAVGTPVTLEWQDKLISFRPRITGIQQIQSVNVRSWDPKGKKNVTGQASSPQTMNTPGLQRGSVSNSSGGGSSLIGGRVADNSSEANLLAKSDLAGRADAFIEAEGTAFGNPNVKAGGKVKINGVGTKFGGEFLVTAVTHDYRGERGYQTSFEISGRSERGLLDLMHPPARQDWGRDLVVGLVTNNNDPDQMGRVRVKYPSLSDSEESAWARIASVSAGNARGLMMLPQVNEEVIVGFEQGDTRRPIVLGSLFNGRDKPGADLLQNQDGSFALLSNEKGHIHAKKDLEIKSDQKMVVEIQSDQNTTVKGNTKHETTGNGNLKAQQFTVEAGSSMTIKGVSVTVEASASLTLKGATVDIQGSGPVNIKGAIINLG